MFTIIIHDSITDPGKSIHDYFLDFCYFTHWKFIHSLKILSCDLFYSVFITYNFFFLRFLLSYLSSLPRWSMQEPGFYYICKTWRHINYTIASDRRVLYTNDSLIPNNNSQYTYDISPTWGIKYFNVNRKLFEEKKKKKVVTELSDYYCDLIQANVDQTEVRMFGIA